MDMSYGDRHRGWLFLLGFVVIAATVVGVGTQRAGAQSDDERFDNEYCLGCHAADDLTATLPSGEILDLGVDPGVYGDSVHGRLEMSCVLCHTDIEGFPHDPLTAGTLREYTIDANQVCADCHLEQFTATQDNVHGDALAAGNLEAATCSDCHGAHDVAEPVEHSPETVATCGTCHGQIFDLYGVSAHGEALATGNRDVPTCTDCHGVHELEGPGEEERFRLFSPRICAECHADDDLMDRYGISTNVFESYISDFHGTTVVLFEKLAPDQETNKAVCIDCHGVHAIRSADDPESTVNKAHLLQTCQRCHPDATENFPDAWLSHYIPEPGRATVVFGVSLFYRIIIPAVIGAMLLYVIMHVLRRRIERRRASESG